MTRNISDIGGLSVDAETSSVGQGSFEDSVEKQIVTGGVKPVRTPFSGVQKFKESTGQMLADIGEAIARFEGRNG